MGFPWLSVALDVRALWNNSRGRGRHTVDATHSVRCFLGDPQPWGCVRPRTTRRPRQRKSKSSMKNGHSARVLLLSENLASGVADSALVWTGWGSPPIPHGTLWADLGGVARQLIPGTTERCQPIARVSLRHCSHSCEASNSLIFSPPRDGVQTMR